MIGFIVIGFVAYVFIRSNLILWFLLISLISAGFE